ncbi:MAG: hypothetical protein M3Q68_08460, partial [Actinomycetota bacterium]|nr:hypothetical protein [Actinomycetota bacterium]
LFGEDLSEAYDHPLFVAHGVAGVVSMALVVAILAGLVLRIGDRAPGAFAPVASGLTLLGTVAVAGGIWAEGFLVPFIGGKDPSVLVGDPGGVLLTALIAGGALFSTGWLSMAIVLRQADLASRATATVLGVSAVVAFLPFPGTTLVFLVALAVVTARVCASPAAASAPLSASAVPVNA